MNTSPRLLKSLSTLGVVTIFALAGCSSQTSEEYEEGQEGPVDSTESAFTPGCGFSYYSNPCPTAPNLVQSHKEATRYMRYVFGDDTAVPTPGYYGAQLGCDWVRDVLLDIRARIQAGTVTVERLNSTVCTRSSSIYTLRPTNGVPVLRPVDINAIYGKMYTCNGWPGTGGFALINGQSSTTTSCTATEINENTYLTLDPTPATLSASLSGSNYAFAAAVNTTGDQEIAHRWPSSGISKTGYVNNGSGQYVTAQTLAGRPCLTGTTTASAGTVVNPRLAIIGSYVSCR